MLVHMAEAPTYKKPDWFTQHLFNPAVKALTRIGISVMGSRILRVRGRSSGQWRETAVNLLPFEGDRYLVAPRGETQWVRNLRTAGSGELRVGRRVERFTAEEVMEGNEPVMREYLRRWRWEVGMFFNGVTATSPDDAVREEAQRHPVFRLHADQPSGSAGL